MPNGADHSPSHWPLGDGEMATRIREHDWAATPLGPVSSWPQSLKTAVRTALDSAFPTFVWWGPELIALHNDAALAILRVRHPGALGRPASEVWSDVWPDVGPVLAQVLETGEPSIGEGLGLVLHRGGPRQPANFTFGYGVMRDEGGDIAGVQAVAFETTGGGAESALRASEKRYRTLFESMDEGFCIIEKMEGGSGARLDFRYVAANPAFSAISGMTDVVGKTCRELVPGVDEDWLTTYSTVLQTGVPIRFERELEPLGLLLDLYAFRIDDDAHRRVAVLFNDLTQRKRAEAALRESEERFRTFAENSTDTLWIVDAETGQLEYLSPAFDRTWGESRETVLRDIGRWAESVHPEDRDEALQAMAHGRAGENHASEYRIIRGDGEVRWINDNGFPICDDMGVVRRVAGIAQDVTAQRQARDELAAQVAAATAEMRALSRRLLAVQEEERRNLARELHDEIGQALTVLQLQLGSVEQEGGVALDEAKAIVGELTGRVREMSMDLRPAALDALGLLPTLLWHVDRFQARTGVRVDLRRAGLERRFWPGVEIAAYRVVQEALTNVARHAGTDAATVHLLADEAALTVAVRDEGRGFDPDGAVGAGGLSGMRERIELLGGTLDIDAAPGQGVTVTAEIPLRGAGGRESEAESRSVMDARDRSAGPRTPAPGLRSVPRSSP